MKTSDFGFIALGVLIGITVTYLILPSQSSPIYEVQVHGAVIIRVNKATGDVWNMSEGQWKPIGRAKQGNN